METYNNYSNDSENNRTQLNIECIEQLNAAKRDSNVKPRLATTLAALGGAGVGTAMAVMLAEPLPGEAPVSETANEPEVIVERHVNVVDPEPESEGLECGTNLPSGVIPNPAPDPEPEPWVEPGPDPVEPIECPFLDEYGLTVVAMGDYDFTGNGDVYYTAVVVDSEGFPYFLVDIDDDGQFDIVTETEDPFIVLHEFDSDDPNDMVSLEQAMANMEQNEDFQLVPDGDITAEDDDNVVIGEDNVDVDEDNADDDGEEVDDSDDIMAVNEGTADDNTCDDEQTDDNDELEVYPITPQGAFDDDIPIMDDISTDTDVDTAGSDLMA